MTEFRTTFEVSATPSDAWKALEALQVDHVDEVTAPRRWWLPAFDSTGTEVEVESERALTVRKDSFPCAGTLIAITFEHIETGARITVVQSGFDEGFVEASGEGFWIVCEQLAADLHLFFETGVVGGRHGRPWTPVGCGVIVTPLGLEVTDVADGTWASRAGLQPGDVLLTLAGAPLTTMRELITVQRIFGPGVELTGTWVRNRERFEAMAPV